MDTQGSAPQASINIDVLTGFLDSMQSYSSDLIQHLRSGQTLCHYTSLEGAIGIIGGNDLWLTNTRFSNDDEELRHGHRLVDEVLDEFEKAAPDQVRRDSLSDLRKAVTTARGEEVYVCCFCEKDNLLSQWRGYAENGGGVSIEFDAAGFAVVGGPDSPHGLMRLWKVFYKRDQQREIIRKCVDYPYWPGASDADHIPYIVDAIQFFMPTFKNGDFSDEQERRLIFTPRANSPIKQRFRTHRGLLVPYFSLKELSLPGAFAGDMLPIKGVSVGPGLYRALNVESARMLLAKSGYLTVPVQASTTPYRG